MTKQKDFKIFSGFIIKIFAIVFMTFDHIGLFLNTHENMQEISSIFRIIGRFALPLFIFLLVEGIRHTSNIKKYFIRISFLAIAFFVGQLFYYIITKGSRLNAPTVDLLLTLTCVYLLNRKDKFSFLAVLPVLWATFSMFAKNYEVIHLTKVQWCPFFLRPDYHIYGIILGIGFYYANELATLFLNSKEETKSLLGTSYERTASNLLSAFFIIITTIVWVILDEYAFNSIFTIEWQVYAVFSFIPILFYSGKRGYNAKWFKYGCYIYFPTHLIVIFLIFALL